MKAKLFATVLILSTLISCKKSVSTDPVYTAPVLTTSPVINITSSTATCGGNITADGGTPVTTRGVAWSTVSNYRFEQCFTTQDGFEKGTYTSTLTALLPHTTYYVRAYAGNGKNLFGFGQEIAFTTP